MALPQYPSVPLSFLGLDPIPWDRARVAILPVPYDSTTGSGGGCRAGPAAIIEASREIEPWDDETGRDWSEAGILTLAPVAPDMRGPGPMVDRVAKAAGQIVRAGKLPVGLGGEHSVSIGLIKACLERFPGLTVLQLDAHLELRNTCDESPFSHAAAMRRVRELAPVVPVGIRSVSKEETDYVRDEKLRVFHARDIVGRTGWELQVLDLLGEQVYVTIDASAFDPAVIPGAAAPEPGGLTWYEGLRLLRMVGKQRQVVGLDFVELSPTPPSRLSEKAAARLVYKAIGYALDRG